MKKILVLGLIVGMFFLSGCGKYNEKSFVKDLTKKIEKSSGYLLKGSLSIRNNDDIYKYEVDASYQDDDNYRVSLKNKTNSHEQIILKNSDGVYVLTPSLNKSFKFQSEWPNNSSQVYLLQSLLKDIKDDDKKTFETTDKGYVITTKVNYPNNRKLVNQKIYFDKKLNPTKVEVFDKDGVSHIVMSFTSVDMSATFDKKYFALNDNMSAACKDEEACADQTIATEDFVIDYPMFMPENTALGSQDKVSKSDGERVIMTFKGDNPFMLVQETVSKEAELLIIPMYGDPDILIDTVGSVSENSITWMSNGKEYYIVSDVLDKDTLVEIARSINSIPVMK